MRKASILTAAILTTAFLAVPARADPLLLNGGCAGLVGSCPDFVQPTLNQAQTELGSSFEFSSFVDGSIEPNLTTLDWGEGFGGGGGEFTTAQELLEETTVSPEPGTMALLGTGLFGLAAARRRRRKAEADARE
ncbi:MAG TPA: PEP-CTERM sorting domain-containing protein [Longimicrobium sp.]|nr:PEP-CTERM sorting domain-containing protein [Longimicrobium sp.]